MKRTKTVTVVKNKMVVQFNIPFQVFKRFKEKAKPTGEILAFLAGVEKNDTVTVSHIIFPIQYHPRSEIEVVEKGKSHFFIKRHIETFTELFKNSFKELHLASHFHVKNALIIVPFFRQV